MLSHEVSSLSLHAALPLSRVVGDPAGGEVKARGDRRRARSDWMAIERERGISVSSAVMSFEHDGLAFNLLDTPGHKDLSGDTYGTLRAVATAVMLLVAARGIEEQTRRL